MASVTLIDYGVGNISAFAHIYRCLNISIEIADSVEKIEAATHLILPGVGAFDWAMTKLNKSGMRDALDKQVLQMKVPVLGVCVGMQMMASNSEEGALTGLNWIEAQVVRFSLNTNLRIPLPHMGWNDVLPKDEHSLFNAIADPRFYFLHSYVMKPVNDRDILATTSYGSSFVSAIQRDNIFGTQFHPEKSHRWGISLLQNFVSV